ncbi:MAG: hypothetical protein K0R17_3598 [Rariglobus sp.]|jgi:hypothetical protein|nr:hypothetical protein [Rariglobus sp.]
MKLNCPTCGQPLRAENINLQTDLALCTGCNQVARPSALADAGFSAAALQNPPKGAWFRQRMNEVVIGATTRHPIAFVLVPFMCVWSGLALGGIYGTQIKDGEFNLVMSLFGLPFLAGSILFGSIALMAVCGKVEVRLRDRQGIVFVGIGPLGWKRGINLNEVDSLTEEGWAMNYPGGQGIGIVLQGRTRLRFATNLTEARRHFMFNALKAVKAGKA